MDGLLIIDKKENMTSFDVIRDIRKKYNQKQVGHIGTLDPLASGVLPILIGKATKLSDYLMQHDKEYIAKIQLGFQTDTADREGKIIMSKNVEKSKIMNENVEKVLQTFLGESMQTPPMYSAIKINGKKLYELARQNIEVERKERKIFINSIELINIDKEKNEIEYKVECSKGTYIRTLSEDIAKKLETVGHMSYLRRTRVGNFKIEDAGKFIPMEEIITSIQSIEIEQNDLQKLINGVPIELDKIQYRKKHNDCEQICKLYNNNQFLGYGTVKGNFVKRKILI